MAWKDPERAREYRRAYYLAHRERELARKYKYIRAHRERVNASRRAYYASHREEMAAAELRRSRMRKGMPPDAPVAPRADRETRAVAVEMARGGMRLVDIAARLGWCARTISTWLRRAGQFARELGRERRDAEDRELEEARREARRGNDRRAYLARLMREALPGAIRAARAKRSEPDLPPAGMYT